MWLFGLGQGPYGFLEIDELLISGVDMERTQADISALKSLTQGSRGWDVFL